MRDCSHAGSQCADMLVSMSLHVVSKIQAFFSDSCAL